MLVEQSESRRARFLFRTGSVDRRYAWFEQRGEDLYFGPLGGKTLEGATAKIVEQGMEIYVPPESKVVPVGPLKASFHASGQFHVSKGRERYEEPMRWSLKHEIQAPYRIAVLISKHPRFYEPYPGNRSLTRRQTSAFVLRLREGEEATRHYFEFFVTPAGTWPVPQPLLSMSPEAGERKEDRLMTFSLNEHLILVARHFTMAHEDGLSQWHPELSIWVFGDDASNRMLPPQ